MGHAACAAPTRSLYFLPTGDVRSCCNNSATPLGNVQRQTLRQIWDGEPSRRLREAMVAHDYSLGCGFCEWEVASGPPDRVFARRFDFLGWGPDAPEWPTQMEFALTNRCNLQCVMCNGDLSSSIRQYREQRAPLPRAYDDGFFAELNEFLPHLEQVNFVGGEPFTGPEPLRVMEALIDLGLAPSITVTTNGTIWNDRVARICAALPISFCVSLDGVTAATFESIRIGASYDAVLANLDRFDEIVAGKGTAVSLAYCLMTMNWHEFADLLLFAEARGYDVDVNVVVFPRAHSLFQLSAEQLIPVIEELERHAVTKASRLTRLRPVFDGQLAALRSHLESLQSSEVAVRVGHGTMRDEARDYAIVDTFLDDMRAWAGGADPGALACDAEDRIVSVDTTAARLLDVSPGDLVGQDIRASLARMQELFGQDVRSRPTDDGAGSEAMFLDDQGRVTAELRSVIQPNPDDLGTTVYFVLRSLSPTEGPR